MCVRDKGWTALQAPNQDHGLLQLAAMVTMVIDHIGVVFFPGLKILRVIGRIAFPLFCWGIAVGAEKTRSSAAMP